jgi:transcription initiation factor TFIIF subunit alpha
MAPQESLPNGQQPSRALPIVKKAKAVDPLFGRKKKPTFKAAQPQTKSLLNGAPPPAIRPQPVRSPIPPAVPSPGRASPALDGRKTVSGFSDPNGTVDGVGYRDYKLVTTKRDVLQGMRFHVLQFIGESPIDLRDERDFTRPVRLHRRDPRAIDAEQAKAENGDGAQEVPEAEEKEEIDKRKEARRLEREANLAQVAPSAEAGKRTNAIKKKTAQVYNRDYTPEERMKMQNNYEEKLPWHIEDFDNKHCYVGTNLTGSSNIHAAFVYERSMDTQSGQFRMLPIEKMYQFKPRKTFKTMSIEEAENAMKKKGRDPQWLIERRAANLREAQLEQIGRRNKAFFGTRDDTAAGRGDEAADLDFNMEEDFADDEEGDMFFEKDEDEKLAESRIKEDQLNANVFALKEEKEYDRAEERELRERERKKLISKGIKKALERREKNFDHASDSDDPFGSSVSHTRATPIVHY